MKRLTLVDALAPRWSQIRSHRPILPPLLVGWGFSVVTAWSLHPLLLEAAHTRSDAVRSALTLTLWMLAALAPVFALLRTGALTLLTWAAATLAGADRPPREVLSIYLYGDALCALFGVMLALWFHLASAVSGRAPQMVDPLSLPSIVPFSHSGVAAVAGMVSVSGGLWVVYTAFALRYVSELRPAMAWTLTATASAGAIAFTYLRAGMGGS